MVHDSDLLKHGKQREEIASLVTPQLEGLKPTLCLQPDRTSVRPDFDPLNRRSLAVNIT